MSKINKETIKYLSKYTWYDVDYAVKNEPYKIIAYAMRYATIEDFPVLNSLTKEVLKDVLKNAQTGWFDKKNWVFWHTILRSEPIPEFPKRKFL